MRDLLVLLPGHDQGHDLPLTRGQGLEPRLQIGSKPGLFPPSTIAFDPSGWHREVLARSGLVRNSIAPDFIARAGSLRPSSSPRDRWASSLSIVVGPLVSLATRVVLVAVAATLHAMATVIAGGTGTGEVMHITGTAAAAIPIRIATATNLQLQPKQARSGLLGRLRSPTARW